MRIDAISIGINPPHDVNVIIGVPVGGEPIKYEMDKNAGTPVVDRFLHTAMRYPGNYGFIPHTLSGDGDPRGRFFARQCPSLARTGPPAMSALRSLSGVNRTWREMPNSVANDPQRTLCRRAALSTVQSSELLPAPAASPFRETLKRLLRLRAN